MFLTNEQYMEASLALAREALFAGEVPVGCVIVNNQGEIIGRGRNRREEKADATAHAEIEAIRDACAHQNSWHLDDCTLYVTLEPCPMCAGAILMSRIGTIIYGAKEEKTGSCGSIINLFSENYGQHPKIYGGILAEESMKLLQSFFEDKRSH